MKRAILLLTLLLLASPAWAGDWTQFRGPGGSGVATETDLPVRWSATEGLRWKVELPGRGLSSPVVSGGRVYVTACSGFRQTRLHVLCFDSGTGKKLWERQVWATGNTACNNKTCMAAPTPVTDGERIYALFATCDLVCYDRDGNLLWYRPLNRDYPTLTNQVGMAASPILWRDLLILALETVGDSFAAGIDKITGQNKWKIERSREINWVTPLVIDNGGRPELLLQSPRELTGHNPETGKELWKREDKGFATIPSAVPGPGIVLVPAADLLALKPGLKEPEVLWRSARLKPATGSPLVYQNRVYILNSAGFLVCAEAADGKELWRERLQGPFSASPVGADGKVYVVNEEGKAFVVQVGDQPQLLSTNAIGESILGTPAIADGAIFLRSDKHLYCIGGKKSK